MNFQFLDQTMKNPYLIPGLITVTTVASLLLNWYGLTVGITYVLPHLFYIPIILVSYYYPRRGILFTIALSALYGVLVLGPGHHHRMLLSRLSPASWYLSSSVPWYPP